jgi:multidrug resistance protein, MATE family
MSICYGIFIAPRTAWYPLSSRMFKGLGVLVQLGLSGVGKYSFQPRNCGLTLESL